MEKIDAEYKARIMELESQEPSMPPEQHEARIAKLKNALATIALRLEDGHKLLDDATETWTLMEEIVDLVAVYEQVKETQQHLEEVKTTMKDRPPLQRMF